MARTAAPERFSFGNLDEVLELPDLIAIQRESFEWFLRRGLVLTGVGLGIGLLASAAIMRLLSSLLFGVSPFDPLTYAVVVPALGAVAILATWLPARHATRVDPSMALRSQ